MSPTSAIYFSNAQQNLLIFIVLLCMIDVIAHLWRPRAINQPVYLLLSTLETLAYYYFARSIFFTVFFICNAFNNYYHGRIL